MKILITLMAVMISTAGFTQNEQYFLDMKANISELKKADDEKKLESSIERIKAIHQAEPDQWLPAYYAAFAILKMTEKQTNAEKLEQYFDEATSLASNALDQWPSETELMVLLAGIYIQKCNDKDYENSLSNIQIAQELLETAIQMNPQNPRAYYMMGKSIFELNKKVAANTGESCEYFTMAADLFESYKPESEIHPLWGTDLNSRFIASCKDKIDPADIEEQRK